ncbi:hypothetical protein WJS89_10605 [Sphingomicrobium sp. XHP0235]|uniref:hypothetical protein n=1 Tax=Sphingomicrobium aquimarinum TaxID=3133971 RepID=UPI0031FE6977
MAILFAGGEADALTPSGPDAYESGGSPYIDTTFARVGMRVDASSASAADASDYWSTSEWGNETDFWLHCEVYHDTIFVAGQYYRSISIFDTSDQETFRITFAREGIRFAYNNLMGGFTTIETFSLGSTQDNRYTFDFHFEFSASGGVTFYVSGTQRTAATGVDLSGLSGGAYARFYSAGKTYWSQIIVSDESTIGKRLNTIPPAGVGADTAWVGDYTRVDEPSYSDADFVNSDTAGDVELFTHANAIPDGYIVNAVIVSARSNRGTSGPTNLQLALRSSGTNYFSASKAQDFGYLTYQNVWESDPATSAGWLNSAAQTLQFGVKSIA